VGEEEREWQAKRVRENRRGVKGGGERGLRKGPSGRVGGGRGLGCDGGGRGDGGDERRGGIGDGKGRGGKV